MNKPSRILLFLFVFLCSFFFVPFVSAQIATDCQTTKVGNPKGDPPPASADCPESGTDTGNSAPGAQKVIELARKQVKAKKTYVWGAPSRNWKTENPDNKDTDPKHFDCSGLVGWAWYWGSDGKVSMYGQTNNDWDNYKGKYERFGPKDKMQPGDVIMFGRPNENKYDNPSHTALFVGKGECKTDDCIIEIYTSGVPGHEISLKERNKHSGKSVTGFLRPVIK